MLYCTLQLWTLCSDSIKLMNICIFSSVRFEVVRIQAIVRGYQARIWLDFQTGQAIMIQRIIRCYLAKNDWWRRRLGTILTVADVKCLQVNSASKKIQRWWKKNCCSKREKAAAMKIERFFIHVKEEVDREIKRHKKAKKARRQKRPHKMKEDDDSLLERVFDKVNEEEEKAQMKLQSIEEAKAIEQAGRAASIELRKYHQLRSNSNVISNQGRSPYRSPDRSKHGQSDDRSQIDASPHKSRHSTLGRGDRHTHKHDRHNGKYQADDIKRSSVRIHPTKQPPESILDTSIDAKSDISGVTAPSIFLKNVLAAKPPKYASVTPKERIEDFSLEDASGRLREIPLYHKDKRHRERQEKRDNMSLSVAQDNSHNHYHVGQSAGSSSRAEFQRARQPQRDHTMVASRDRPSRIGGTGHLGRDVHDCPQSQLDEKSISVRHEGEVLQSSSDINEVKELEQRLTQSHRLKKKEIGGEYKHHSVLRETPHQYHNNDATMKDQRSVRQPCSPSHSIGGRGSGQKHRSSPQRDVKISMNTIEDAIEVNMDSAGRHGPRSTKRTGSQQRISNNKFFDQEMEGSILMRSQSRGKAFNSNGHQSMDHVEYQMETSRNPRMESLNIHGREYGSQHHSQDERRSIQSQSPNNRGRGHSQHNQCSNDKYHIGNYNSPMKSPHRRSRSRQRLLHREVSHQSQHRHSLAGISIAHDESERKMERSQRSPQTKTSKFNRSEIGQSAPNKVGMERIPRTNSQAKSPMRPQSRSRHQSQSQPQSVNSQVYPSHPTSHSIHQSQSLDMQAESGQAKSSMRPHSRTRHQSLSQSQAVNSQVYPSNPTSHSIHQSQSLDIVAGSVMRPQSRTRHRSRSRSQSVNRQANSPSRRANRSTHQSQSVDLHEGSLIPPGRGTRRLSNSGDLPEMA